MIVPRSRLLFWVAVIIIPFSLLGGIAPATLGVSLTLIGGLLLIAAADAVAAPGCLGGIAIEMPAVVRMSLGRVGKLELRIRNVRQQSRKIRMALAVPREIKPESEETEVALPAGAEWSRLTWAGTPSQRGKHLLASVFVEGGSPLGFWSFRKRLPATAEIRVYPSLLGERKNLAALFLNRGGFGLHAERQIGKGRDFEKLREYVPGDGYDEIHWKATARRGRPITKVFQIERTQEVYVIVDASRLSARVSSQGDGPGTSVLERFVTAALVLGMAAEKQGDLFGLITFTDKVETFVRAKNGRSHYSTCRDALYTLQPKIVSPDFDELCGFIRLRLRRRALLVFLTALDDPALAESFARQVELIRHQHLILVNMVRPRAVAPLFAGLPPASVDDLYQHLGGHLQWQKLRELQIVLQRRAVRFSLLDDERLSADLVSQYMGVKQRQLL